MDNQEKDISLVEEYNQQGRVLYSLDKYEEAIPYYIKAEEEEPTYIQTYFNLTEVYVMLDRFDEARKYDEEKGYPEGGIAPGTKWEDIPDDFECPLCSVGKDQFSVAE